MLALTCHEGRQKYPEIRIGTGLGRQGGIASEIVDAQSTVGQFL
jgi:hypothetical protein